MNRTSRFLLVVRFAVLALVLGVCARTTHSQTETGEVLGTVRDTTGAAVSGAAVTLTNKGTEIQAKATTDNDGDYDFLNVAVGQYQVAIEDSGFSKFTSDFRVEVDTRQRVDVSLQVGASSASVVVTGNAVPLDTDTSDHGQVISSAAVAELPLIGRNYAELALLSTNAIKSPIAVSFGPTGTPREGAFNVNGMRSTYNTFLLDGEDNNAYSTSNQGYSAQVVQPSPDAIAEFKVITSNYSAEYGRVGGAVVDAIMKSGTNQFHGSLYEFLRNTALNATGFLFSPAPKNPLERNQFGGSVGGPILKNRIFFFGDFEGFRQDLRYNNFDSIPTAAEVGGVLPVSVVDPLTNVVYPAGSTIPIATLNSFASTVLSQLPPTTPGLTGASNNLLEQLLITDNDEKYDVKIDGKINDTMSGFLRFSERWDTQYYQPDIPGASGGNGNGHIKADDQNLSVGYTWTPSPTSIVEARFGLSHIAAGKMPVTIGEESMQALYGISGLPTSPNLTGGLNSQAVSGLSQFGRQTSNPQFQNPTSFGPKFSFSKIDGRHSFKVGYEFLAIRTEILDVNPLYGEDTYGGQFSKPTCAQLGMASGCTIASNSTAYDLADFIFGTPSTINLGNDDVVNLRQHVQALYFQDDYRVTSKLTLNLGLRWDFATPLYERDNNYSDFNPVTDTMTPATSGSLFDRSLVHPNYKNFGPRIGLAYSIFPKTVFRAAYGISYDYFNRVGSALEGINAPQALFGVISQSIPAGGPVPAGFLTTKNSFTTGIDNPANFNPLVSNVVYIPSNSPWPYVQTWFAGIQQEITKDTIFEIDYNGNHSLDLPIIADYNQAAPNAVGGTLGIPARVPIPTFGPITWVDPVGNNNYNGLSLRVEHRFSQGLYFLNSFTWGKALGDSEQALEYYSGYVEANPQNIHDLAAEYGPSSFDIKLNNVTSIVYQLPFGRGQKFGSSMSRGEDLAVGGWEINFINTAHTGTPLNVYYGPTSTQSVSSLTNDYRGEPFLRPNVSGSSTAQSTAQMLNTFFAGYTFTIPAVNDPFGNLSRNDFRAPGFEQLDFSADKTFSIREGMSLQFRSEFFNLLNRTNFGIPNTQTTSSAFGTIRTTYPSRQIQFGLKLLF
jgi:carboxypeptidase family protein/TonB-dependent receptor-like protein